jgi:hypothetical protein
VEVPRILSSSVVIHSYMLFVLQLSHTNVHPYVTWNSLISKAHSLVWYQCETCLVSVWNMFGISVKHVLYQCETCVVSVWNMFGISVKHVWYQCETCLVSVRNMFGISAKHVWYQCETCLVSVWNMFSRPRGKNRLRMFRNKELRRSKKNVQKSHNENFVICRFTR